VARERVTWALIVALLLIASLLIGRHFVLGSDDAREAETVDASFREWFWERRGLDLVAQVGLIFAGALGIAALLPREEEDDA
jgi:hypothetical protein